MQNATAARSGRLRARLAGAGSRTSEAFLQGGGKARLLCSQNRPRRPTTGAAEKGHKRTHALQQKTLYSITSSARPSSGRG